MRKIVLLILLIVSSQASAQSYNYGYINSDGYVWDGEYWSWGGYQYTRTLTPYQYWNGCAYVTYYKGAYSVVSQKIHKQVDNVEDIIARGIVERDRTKNAIVAEALKHRQFVEKIRAANLDKDIGFSLYYPSNSLQIGSFGINGTTTYGYPPSLTNFVDPFKVNLDAALLQYGQVVQSNGDANFQLQKAFGETVNVTFAKAADLSGIAARVSGLERLAKTIDGPPSTSTFSTTSKPLTVATSSDDLSKRWNKATTSCIGCHYGNSGEKKDGGFSLSTFTGMSVQDKFKVIKRLELPTSDPGHMPQKQPTLSLEDYRAWVEVASQPTTKSE